MNMKALISSIELRETGFRVAQVEPDENVFAVAEVMFWIDCADDVVADVYWYDPQDQVIKPVLTLPVTGINNQPISQGAQTL